MASSARNARIEIRATASVRTLAERASAAKGTSMAEYISGLIERDAPEVLKRQATITVTNDQFDRFMAVCQDDSLVPSSRILEAARRLDQEGF